MGTNYYLHRNVCERCGRGDDEPLHIGKSSFGWCFGLHVIPAEGIDCLDDWKELFANPSHRIKDEYGGDVSAEEMVRTITERSFNGQRHDGQRSAEYLQRNHAVEGPNGLMRHAIGAYCIGHGAGTWDLMPGEFS